MTEPRRALYVGRFQVFHLGHLDVLEHIDRAADIGEIVVAVGSAQYDDRHRSPVAPWTFNPFTVEERLEMIRASLEGKLTKPWTLTPVPDFHDWEKWYQHLVGHLPAFHVLYTSDTDERDFFRARGIEARPIPRNFDFHAGAIRQWLLDDDPRYRTAVPPAVAAIFERIGAGARLRELAARDRASSQRSGAP